LPRKGPLCSKKAYISHLIQAVHQGSKMRIPVYRVFYGFKLCRQLVDRADIPIVAKLQTGPDNSLQGQHFIRQHRYVHSVVEQTCGFGVFKDGLHLFAKIEIFDAMPVQHLLETGDFHIIFQDSALGCVNEPNVGMVSKFLRNPVPIGRQFIGGFDRIPMDILNRHSSPACAEARNLFFPGIRICDF